MQTELNKYQDELQEKIGNSQKVNYRPRRFPIDFDDITIDFYNDWIRFFNEKNYSPNTIGKHIKWFKTILKESKEKGLHFNEEFERRAFKPISSDVVSVYLNEAELNKIFELDLSENPELIDARDVFLVGCYTAQRFSDYCRIDRISELDDGTKVIKLTQKKTGTPVSIPIMDELMAILKKYEVSNNEIQLPKISEQHLNRQIKKVAAKAGINDLIEVKKTKGGLVIRPSYPKSSLITSHTARRSGCSNQYNAGVASQYIMRISGHKTEREFLKYLKLTPDEVAKKLSKHDYFKGNELRIAK
jgi:integrase